MKHKMKVYLPRVIVVSTNDIHGFLLQALIDAHLREERGSLNEEEGKRRQQLEEWKRERSMRREVGHVR